jgi:hypothetical protein
MKTIPYTVDNRVVNWKKMLRRMKLDEIKRKSPGFFEASGAYESSLAPTFRDSSNKDLAKAVATFLACTGFNVQVLNQVRVRIREIPRYNIFSEKYSRWVSVPK